MRLKGVFVTDHTFGEEILPNLHSGEDSMPNSYCYLIAILNAFGIFMANSSTVDTKGILEKQKNLALTWASAFNLSSQYLTTSMNGREETRSLYQNGGISHSVMFRSPAFLAELNQSFKPFGVQLMSSYPCDSETQIPQTKYNYLNTFQLKTPYILPTSKWSHETKTREGHVIVLLPRMDEGFLAFDSQFSGETCGFTGDAQDSDWTLFGNSHGDKYYALPPYPPLAMIAAYNSTNISSDQT